jgi:hypothetical protein
VAFPRLSVALREFSRYFRRRASSRDEGKYFSLSRKNNIRVEDETRSQVMLSPFPVPAARPVDRLRILGSLGTRTSAGQLWVIGNSYRCPSPRRADRQAPQSSGTRSCSRWSPSLRVLARHTAQNQTTVHRQDRISVVCGVMLVGARRDIDGKYNKIVPNY